jgi:hypothetical protein
MAYKLKSSVKSLCSGSALSNLKSGGKMISSDKGSSNYMKEGPLYAKEDIGKPGYDKYGAELMGTKRARLKKEKAGSTRIVDDSMRREVSGNSNSSTPSGGGKSVTPKPATTTSAGPAPTIKPGKVVKEVVKKQAPKSDTKKDNTPPAVTGSDAVRLAKIKANKKNKSAAPEALTGSDAVKVAKIKEKKKGKEMSRGEIREAKKKDKDSGMSRKEVRLNKTKRKAASTRAKTVSKETAAKGGKEAQRLARKTIRLEKKAAKIEGRVKASKIK